MAWRRRWFGVLVLAFGLVASGCTGLSVDALSPPPTPNAQEVPPPTDPARPPVTRSQRDDLDGPTVGKAVQLAQATVPPPQTSTEGIRPQGTLRLSVRAWVNDKPIFDSEVDRLTLGKNMAYLGRLKMQAAGPPISPSAQNQYAKEYRRLFNDELELLIDSELSYQDAMKKLEQNQKMLDKLKAAATKDFEKKLAGWVKASGKETVEEFKHLLAQQGGSIETMRRSSEREFISREYERSLIGSVVMQIGQKEVREWYDQHANEFQTVDSVRWQDIFILGDNHPTPGGARRYAEELLARIRKGEDFEKLLQCDEGDSWRYRKGDGFGRTKGEITPREVEPHLFRMKDGDVGPLLEMTSGTGVHLFRLVKRDFGGLKPFDDKIQTEILIKLRNEAAQRELRRIHRELRSRSVIVYEPQVGL